MKVQTMSATKISQVVVIGAGIFGVSTAVQLQRRGIAVTLLNDGPAGNGASGRSLSWLNSARMRSDDYHRLRMAGIDRYRTLANRVGKVDWLSFEGGLTWDADDAKNEIAAAYAHEVSLAYDALHLRPDDVAGVTPGVDAATITPQGAIFNPGEGWVDLPALIAHLLKEFSANGGTLVTDQGAAKVIVENGRAVGAVTADGRAFRARAVASNLNPKLLYQRIVAPQHLDDDTRQRIAAYRCGSGTFRMNVALAELPDFTAAPGTALQPHHQSGILVGHSLAYFEQAYFDAKSRAHNAGWARAPVVEVVISSTLDDTLAPPGRHVASLFCQQVNPQVEGGWDAHRDTVARLMIDTVDAFAPNFARSVLGYEALSPLDLERRFGLVGGDIFHGALGLDQLFSTRPLLGQAHYRGAVPGLYLCGSGSHPGGGVTGLPGRNAAREILRDRRAFH